MLWSEDFVDSILGQVTSVTQMNGLFCSVFVIVLYLSCFIYFIIYLTYFIFWSKCLWWDSGLSSRRQTCSTAACALNFPMPNSICPWGLKVAWNQRHRLQGKVGNTSASSSNTLHPHPIGPKKASLINSSSQLAGIVCVSNPWSFSSPQLGPFTGDVFVTAWSWGGPQHLYRGNCAVSPT